MEETDAPQFASHKPTARFWRFLWGNIVNKKCINITKARLFIFFLQSQTNKLHDGEDDEEDDEAPDDGDVRGDK